MANRPMGRLNASETRINKKLISELAALEAGGDYGQLPVIWDRAKGAAVWDVFGNYYIDFTSTIFVTNCGHGAVSKAIREQSKRLLHAYTYPTRVKLEFLRTLKKFMPSQCEKIFLASSGSETTSWAVELMRKYKKGGIVVHIDGAFHGKAGQIGHLYNQELKLPFLDASISWADISALLYQNEPNISGVMIESFQGWSGSFMDKQLIQQLVAWAQTRDIPVCFDEIQGGFYRTGHKFAYNWYEVEPDLITVGKALGGGMPISALVGRAKYFANVSGLSSTHSGTPICCVAAQTALKIYNKMDKVDFRNRIEYFENQLNIIQQQHPSIIRKVNCHGFLAGLITPNTEIANRICDACLEQKLIVVKTGRESVKLGPPIVITEKELIKGISRLALAINEVDTGGM